MACNSGTCQSRCYRDGDIINGEKTRHPVIGESEPSANGHRHCIKCKVNETITTTHPDVTAGQDVIRFCVDCFRGNLFGKFRFAVTSNAMITPSDNVLVAFSGGAFSRVALQFVHEMQEKAQRNFDASRDRSLPVFGVGVAYIDESTSFSVPFNNFDQAIDEMKLIVSSLSPPAKPFHVVPTESICAAGRAQLTELISAVNDVTGKEDFIEHLRMLSLQKIAKENGYTKIVLGTCTSRIACHVLQATVKGQGFSLAADIQYVDARRDIPLVLPLRDCLSEELNMLCSMDSLKTIEVLEQPRSGINGLISSFVKLLREENSSRESTIVRTAGKLTPFCFNRIPEVDDQKGSQRRQKKYNLKPSNESLPPESFCIICRSPIKKSSDIKSSDNGGRSPEIVFVSCPSCQYQILPKDPSALEYFHSLLPQSMTSRAKDSDDNQKWMREQIQDCLLSDTDDVT